MIIMIPFICSFLFYVKQYVQILFSIEVKIILIVDGMNDLREKHGMIFTESLIP